jgi:hypothetical protein
MRWHSSSVTSFIDTAANNGTNIYGLTTVIGLFKDCPKLTEVQLKEHLVANKTSVEGHVRIDDLVFSLTRQCNALCDHCCNDDSPQKKVSVTASASGRESMKPPQ